MYILRKGTQMATDQSATDEHGKTRILRQPETLKCSETTHAIIGASYEVANHLGYGFLEKVYENALKIELESRGLHVRAQTPLEVYYKEAEVGKFYADLLVGDEVVVEIKAEEKLNLRHQPQVLNYLRGTRKEVGLLVNFGRSGCKHRRFVY